MTLFINEADKIILDSILNKYRNDFDFYAFGSRVSGKCQKYSDLDLCLIKKKDTPIYRIVDDFEESNLSFKVDVVDYNLIDDNFKKIIDSNKINL